VIATDADCLDAETFIATDNGPTKIKNINPGDYVKTHTGNYKMVSSVNKKEDVEEIEICVNGVKIICTPEHKIPVFRDGSVQIIKANDFLNSDLLLIKK
jgi:hypothetical protein